MEKNKKFSGDWTELIDEWQSLDHQWNDFWAEVEAYANEHRISTRYVEEEFLIDGEFQAVKVNYGEDEEFPES